jgi:hypothetical protein
MQLRDRLKPSLAVLIAVLVVCSGAASATAVAGTAPTASTTEATATDAAETMAPDNESTEPADQIYVDENGDAVLVYEQDQTDMDSTATGNLGLDVSQGLMHVLVRDEIEDGSEVTGDAQFILTPDSLAGNGSMQAPRPETLDNLEADVSATRTPSEMSAQASFDMTYTSESEYSSTSQIESATTEGSMSVSADAFETSGSANVELTQDLGVVQKRSYTLEEGTDQYRLQASEEYAVSSYVADQWNTEAKAKQTLESQYASIARALGGSATVTIQSYSYTNSSTGQDVLDIEYQIVYSNIDDALAQRVTQSLMNAEDIDVSQETAEAFGDGLANMNVDRVQASLDAEGTSVNSQWDVKLSNYDELARASFDLAETAAAQDEELDENVTEQIQQARKNYEAAQAANLVQTVSWEGSLSSPSEQTVQVSASMQYDTENYGTFVEEREARGLPAGGSFSLEASAQTKGDQVVADMKMSVEQEELVDQTLDSIMQSATQAESDTESAQRFVQAFKQSDFEKAKMNVNVGEDEVTFEAGAKFANMESFQSIMSEEFGGELSAMYADVENDSKAYVHVDGAFEGNVSDKETVREHVAVDEDTEIFLPGEWDEEFPSMDEEAAREYLDIEDTETTTSTTTNGTNGGMQAGTNDGTSGESGGLPGFGAPAAFAAVVAVIGLLIGRVNRRDD